MEFSVVIGGLESLIKSCWERLLLNLFFSPDIFCRHLCDHTNLIRLSYWFRQTSISPWSHCSVRSRIPLPGSQLSSIHLHYYIIYCSAITFIGFIAVPGEKGTGNIFFKVLLWGPIHSWVPFTPKLRNESSPLLISSMAFITSFHTRPAFYERTGPKVFNFVDISI